MTQVVHTLRHVGNRRGRRGVTQVQYTSSTCSTTVYCSVARSTLPWFTLKHVCTPSSHVSHILVILKNKVFFFLILHSHTRTTTHTQPLPFSFLQPHTNISFQRFNVSTNYDDGLFHGSFLLPPHHRNHAHPRIHHNHQPENHHP